MKRKTSNVPTRVYSYGCFAPKTGRDVFEQQLRAAHNYYNKLVEIEHARRKAIVEAKALMEDIAPLEQRVKELEFEIESALKALNAKRAGHDRNFDVKKESEYVKEIKAALKVARKVRSDKSKEMKGDPRLKEIYKKAEDTAREAVKDARANSGVYWGTYLKIEEAVKQAIDAPPVVRPGKPPIPWEKLPKFRSYDGSGKVAVQIQDGMTVEGLFSEKGTLVRVRPVPVDTFERLRHQRRLASRTSVMLRVDSTEKSKPVWAEFPIILHRPLPKDSNIKWAWVLRYKVGLRFEYRFQLVIESTEFESPPAFGKGKVALDLGWRAGWDEERPAGTIRVAYMGDDAGRFEEVLVPQKVPLEISKVNSLRGIRDRNFDLAKTWFKSWCEGRDVPDWLRKEVQYLHKWKAPRKLAVVADAWKKQRFEGDEIIVEGLLAWAKQDRHLLFWEANQRNRTQTHRREEYRKLAKRLATAYEVIVLEKLNHRAFEKEASPENGIPSDGSTQRANKKLASPGELKDCILAAAQKYGARVLFVNPAYTSKECAFCGCRDDWEKPSERVHQCVRCGKSWDRDENACRNLLRLGELELELELNPASAEVVA